MSTPNYDINYEDQRFKQVESDKGAALSDLEKTYTDMIDKSDSYYQSQIDASKEWADKQSQLQQEQTDFAIEKIEQNKEQAKKDYTKEQSGAYTDWKKQSNQYGVNAEQQAAQGMQNSGYSESSQVSMYNTYQNRVATAREAYLRTVQNFDNAITEARLQNNALLAEIAYEAQKQQLELSLQGFQYKNQLVLDKTKQKLEVDNMYYQRYQDVLAQINHENALAEQIRQYNESLAEEKRQFDRLYPEEEVATSSGGGGGYYSGGSSKKSSSGSSKSSSGGSSGGSSGSAKVSGSGSSSTTSSGSSNKSSNKDTVTIDTKSVLAAGLGPASEATIVKNAKSGNVNVTQVGNKVVVTKNPMALGNMEESFKDYLANKTAKKTGTTAKGGGGGAKRVYVTK